MGSKPDRSRYIQVNAQSADVAEEQAKSYLGGPMKLEAENKYFLRFMPAFKTNEEGTPIWWSFGLRHYSVPLIGHSDDKVTFDCPRSIGSRCLVCENKKVYQRLGVWDGFRGCSPSKRVLFNVIDCSSDSAIDRGVQVLEDGPRLWKLLRDWLKEDNEMIMDPFEGSVMLVIVKEDDPWRKIKEPRGSVCSLDEIHEDALTWALPENLPDLDEQWDFPSLEEQMENFGNLLEMTQKAVEGKGQKAIQGEVVEDDDDADWRSQREDDESDVQEADVVEDEDGEEQSSDDGDSGSGGSSVLDALRSELDEEDD